MATVAIHGRLERVRGLAISNTMTVIECLIDRDREVHPLMAAR